MDDKVKEIICGSSAPVRTPNLSAAHQPIEREIKGAHTKTVPTSHPPKRQVLETFEHTKRVSKKVRIKLKRTRYSYY